MTTCVLCHSLVATTYRVDSDLVATFHESLERGSNQVRNRLTCTPKAEKSCGLREPRSARQEPSIPRPLAYARGGVFCCAEVLQCVPRCGVFCRESAISRFSAGLSGCSALRSAECSAGSSHLPAAFSASRRGHRNEHGCLAGLRRMPRQSRNPERGNIETNVDV